MSFNLADPDQRADYEYASKWFNFSGKVKELIRAMRLKKDLPDTLLDDETVTVSYDFPFGMREEEAVQSVI